MTASKFSILSEKSVIAELDALDVDDITQSRESPIVSVKEMSADKLIIEAKTDITDDHLIHDVMLDDSEHIEVVHEQSSPPLHSILKAHSRSHSESSDDLGSSVSSSHNFSRENSRMSVTSGDSMLSEYDELKCKECDSLLFGGGRRHRSVSFNEYIDRTTFKGDCCVDSMKESIAVHRRNQRKREVKLRNKERRRCRSNSGGSFSGDDVSMTGSMSDSIEQLSSIESVEPDASVISQKKEPTSPDETNPEGEVFSDAVDQMSDHPPIVASSTQPPNIDNATETKNGDSASKLCLTNSMIYDLDD